MKYFFIVSLFLLASCEKTQNLPETDDQKGLYNMGAIFAKRLQHLDLEEDDMRWVIQGVWGQFAENLKGYQGKSLSDTSVVQKFINKRMEKVAAKNQEVGRRFMEDFKSKGGILLTSGLGYRILKEGSDKKPEVTDTLEVHYHSTLLDGTVFDSSVDRKEKATLPLANVIEGWKQGLPLIGEGGKIELVVPPSLAYGERGSPPAIPAGATLVFEITLFKIVSRAPASPPEGADEKPVEGDSSKEAK